MKELVAAAHALLGIDETALKQLTLMFDRVAIQGLNFDLSKAPFISPELIKVRAWLAELGILFDFDMDKLKGLKAHGYEKTVANFIEDANLLAKPTYGATVQEMIAAREDKEKVAEFRKRAGEFEQRVADGSTDPMKGVEISLRLSTNMTRMVASQLRDVENVDAHPVFPYGFSSLEQDDPRITAYDVVKISLGALPVPVDYVPWQQIIDYRNDPDTKSSFLLIKEWMSEVARGTFKLPQIEETFEYLLNQFRRNQETHQINTTTTGVEAYVVTKPEFLEMLASAGPDWGTRALFTVERCKIGLLEGESTLAGSTVAFLMLMNLDFPTKRL